MGTREWAVFERESRPFRLRAGFEVEHNHPASQSVIFSIA